MVYPKIIKVCCGCFKVGNRSIYFDRCNNCMFDLINESYNELSIKKLNRLAKLYYIDISNIYNKEMLSFKLSEYFMKFLLSNIKQPTHTQNPI